MGIPYLFRSLFSQNQILQQALLNNLPSHISTLSIDVNALIHTAYQCVYGYGEYEDLERQQQNRTMDNNFLRMQVCELTVQILEQIVFSISPNDTLVLAVDGVCPLSKVQQQRRRRYLSGKSKAENQIYDSNEISPGTDLMDLLNEKIKSRIPQWASRPGKPIEKVILSSHRTPGEGEHKIFNYFRDGTLKDEVGKNHVIYGMDSDFILISLISEVKQLYLVRDSVKMILQDWNGKPYRKKKREWTQQQTQQRYIEKSPSEYTKKRVLDVELFRNLLKQLGRGNVSTISDFVFIFGLLGNDFIPTTPSIHTSETTVVLLHRLSIEAAPLTMKGQDGNYRINWNNFGYLISKLSEDESTRLSEVAAINGSSKNPSRMFDYGYQQGTFNYKTFRDGWYSNALGPRNWELAQKIGMQITPEVSRVNEMCEQLLRGLKWTLDYYTQKPSKVTWLWYYPYFHAPLLGDILSVVSALYTMQWNVAGVGKVPALDAVTDTSVYSGEMRYNLMHQMISILPPKSLSVIPAFLHTLYSEDSPIQDLIPHAFEVEKDGFTEERFFIPLIPPADYKRIMLAVSNIQIPRVAKRQMWESAEADHIHQLTLNEVDNLKKQVQMQYGRGYQPRNVQQQQQPIQQQPLMNLGQGPVIRTTIATQMQPLPPRSSRGRGRGR